MTALEELYGHFTNYKKVKNIKEKDKGKINLYAVIYHFPKELFAPFQGTAHLQCVETDHIYDLTILTPVRFIITRDIVHPILGLFSNNSKQIKASRETLENDGWLVNQVSSYINKLYQYYAMEGIHMPYTQEMFIQEHYPEWYAKIQAAERQGMEKGVKKGIKKGVEKGVEKGVKKGEIIGRILLAHKLLRKPVDSKEALLALPVDKLHKIQQEAEAQLIQ